MVTVILLTEVEVIMAESSLEGRAMPPDQALCWVDPDLVPLWAHGQAAP